MSRFATGLIIGLGTGMYVVAYQSDLLNVMGQLISFASLVTIL